MRRAPKVTWKGRSISRRASCDTPFTLRDAFWACNWRTRRSPCPFCRAEHALTPDPCRSNVSATRGATFPQRLCDARRTSFAARRNEPGTPGWDTFCSARRGVRARRTAVDRIGARRLSMDIRSVVRGVAGDGDLLGSPEVRVAVLDGPVDSAHPCFVGANLTRLNTPWCRIPPAPAPCRCTGHTSRVCSSGSRVRRCTVSYRAARACCSRCSGSPRTAASRVCRSWIWQQANGGPGRVDMAPHRANVAAKFPAAKAI